MSRILLIAIVGLVACSRVPAAVAPVAGADGRISDPTQKLARSPHGMVASASPLATAAGASILAAGGNAVDAAVATGFALAVVEPAMSGLGGRTSILLRRTDGDIIGIDGLNQVPRSYRANSGIPAGYETAAIPGHPAALLMLLERYGTMPRAQVMAPAIRYAEAGYALSMDQASFFAGAAAQLRQYPASARYFLKPDGTPYRAGETFAQRDLARTLRAIAEQGAAAFYRGWIADSIHADMSRHGGFITRDELAAYEAMPAIVVRGHYRGHEIVSNFRPAAGHSVIQALQMLESMNVPRTGTAEWASLVAQAMHFAMADRQRSFGSESESARVLTSREHARERAAQIVVSGAEPAQSQLRLQARVPTGVAAGYDFEETAGATPWARPDRENTTHLSTADRFGNVVALTQSLGPALGTRLAASGTGVVFATRLGATPGSRPGSTIAPTIVLRDNRVRYILGGAGDNRIITAVTQTISRIVDHGMTLDQAVAAPRVHPLGATEIRLEENVWAEAVHTRLRGLGFGVSTGAPNYFGRVHAVAVEGEGFVGVAEPRGFGGAAGPVGSRIGTRYPN
jgi:gamma-glutamyltranspeptidase/glutathione hydrolase